MTTLGQPGSANAQGNSAWNAATWHATLGADVAEQGPGTLPRSEQMSGIFTLKSRLCGWEMINSTMRNFELYRVMPSGREGPCERSRLRNLCGTQAHWGPFLPTLTGPEERGAVARREEGSAYLLWRKNQGKLPREGKSIGWKEISRTPVKAFQLKLNISNIYLQLRFNIQHI